MRPGFDHLALLCRFPSCCRNHKPACCPLLCRRGHYRFSQGCLPRRIYRLILYIRAFPGSAGGRSGVKAGVSLDVGNLYRSAVSSYVRRGASGRPEKNIV